jgi:hypothetical protein
MEADRREVSGVSDPFGPRSRSCGPSDSSRNTEEEGMRGRRSPAEAALVEKLAAGERVWTWRTPYAIFVTVLLSTISVAFLAVVWGIHTGSVTTQPEGGASDVVVIVFTYVFTAVWLSLAGYFLGGIAFRSLQFTDTGLRLWSHLGRVVEVELADVIAVVSYGRSSKGMVFWWTEICRADPSARRGFRWTAAVSGTRAKAVASGVRAELIRRCGLSESGPLVHWSKRLHVWRKPDSDSDIPRRRLTWMLLDL